VVDNDPTFFSPPHPFILSSPTDFILGPLFAPAGQFMGKFRFGCPPQRHTVSLAFLFPGGRIDRFGLKVELNGFPFEISKDDPLPQPLDVSGVLNFESPQNLLDVKLVATSKPLMIVIREYQFVGIQYCIDHIVGHHVDLTRENVLVRSTDCEHREPFDFVNFMAIGVATGNMSCPICQREVDLQKLVWQPNLEQPVKKETVELFGSQLDWFDF
jgi:hypothetical protein